ncbi:hypothetical protein KUCAC02_013038 [Chaenocephalus aceratus]|uniref:Uncharacterized protein n=1 Tax=Chaenocephalus aceratus TaxID=36190 RepID=A0ACB9XDN2_CHAAC|nr:hypothetical protein KUCAC02_013038 [Chaenocephalus aceratus]
MVLSQTCFYFHYKQDIHSSRKTPCRGYTLSVIALTLAAHNESLKCERLKMQKDRRRPDTCHPFHPEENSMECGGAVGLTPSLAATLLCVLLALFPR